MVAGGVQTSFVFHLFFFFFFPRLLSGSRAPNSNFSWTRTPFRPVPPAGSVGLFRTPAGAAVQHEPGSVPAASPVAGEMQRLRGEVRSAFPGARGWRLGSGQGGKMAAPASEHGSVAGRGAGVLGTPRQTQLGPSGYLFARVGRCGGYGRVWGNGKLTRIGSISKKLNSERNRADYSLIYSLLLTGKNSDPEKLSNLCEGPQRVHGRAGPRTQALALSLFFTLL